MKLSKVRIREFRSVWDSNEFQVGDVTCLVGKNEAGKTALLKALYRLNPLVTTDAQFDATEDYPRAYVKDYTRALKSGGEASTVVDAWFSLEPTERDELEKAFGTGVLLAAPEVNVWYAFPRLYLVLLPLGCNAPLSRPSTATIPNRCAPRRNASNPVRST